MTKIFYHNQQEANKDKNYRANRGQEDPLITENLPSQEQTLSAILSGQKPPPPRDRKQPLGSSSLGNSGRVYHCRTQMPSFLV